MKVFVYKSARKNDWYLYLPEQASAATLDKLPRQLREALGDLNFALEFDLHPERPLARNNAVQVLQDLHENGFHIQVNDPLADPFAQPAPSS